MIETKNSVALAGGKLVVMGFVVGENETRALTCCGNCENYDCSCGQCDQCFLTGHYVDGSDFCDKWEIRR